MTKHKSPDWSGLWDHEHGFNRALIMHYAATHVRGTRSERTAKAWDYARRRRDAKQQLMQQLRDSQDIKWLKIARMEKELASCQVSMQSMTELLHDLKRDVSE